MGQNKTLELSIQIAGKVDKSLTAALSDTQNRVSNLSQTLSRVGTVGLAAMGALATGTVAALANCTKAAEQFEADMGDVVKYVGGLADAAGKISDTVSTETGKTYAENYEMMKDALLDLSTQIPMTAEELTQLAAAAGQSGKSITDLIQYDQSGNITGFLRDVAMMGTAMDISAEQAGDWAAKWEQAFKMDHDEIMVLADQINYLGANSATTAAEIASAVNDAASLGQIAGADVATTAALADAMLATGVDSGRVANSIKRTYTNLSKGTSATAAMQAQWEELGMTAEGVAKSMQEDSVGTLKSVFEAINNLPKERQVAALSTLFGQWAIEGDAKVVGNMDVFTRALEMVNDPSLYAGSMEREFIIKESTAESIDTMMSNAFYALRQDIGESFLPVKKEFGLMMIDVINGIRENMPELTQLAGTLADLLSAGVSKLGDALQKALPYVQKGLDYVANNGETVTKVLGGMTAAFAAMKFAPTIEGAFRGAGSLLFGTNGGAAAGAGKTGGLFGTIGSLFKGGRGAASATGGILSAFGGAVSGNGFFKTLSTTASSLISGNGIRGTTGLLQVAAGAPGILSGYQGAGSALKNAVASSGAGRYLGGVGNSLGGLASSLGNLGAALGNTKTGGAISGALNRATLGLRQKIAGVGAAGIIQGSILQQNLSELLGGLSGKASGLVSGIANSGAGQAIGGALTSIKGFASSGVGQAIGGTFSSGVGALGSIWSTPLSMFGSLFTGAAPVIAAISGIIAVVSILGDHLEDIRTIVGNVFGDTGLAIFDAFTGKLQAVGDFITGLFADGGVANALAPLQEAITNMFGADAGAAFSGLTTILQSIMGVIGQIVTFATGTVKPIIQDVFSFITGTVMPIILQTFTAAAPTIASIISNIGTAVMTGMQMIGTAIQTLMPIIQGIITVIMNIGSVVVPALLAGFQAFSAGINAAMSAIQGIFEGLISFITGVFTGNWSQAWEGVKQIFGSAFDALVTLCKTPINAVISLINAAISGINRLGITIPEWVPILGGKSFSINIPTIPMLKNGGFTDGVSIAGEAGPEAVISFRRGVRGDNIDTWMQAGRMLGVNGAQAAQAAGVTNARYFADGGFTGNTGAVELATVDAGRRNNAVELADIETTGGWPGGPGGDYPSGQIIFAPQITIQGNADRDVLDEAVEDMRRQFEAWYEQMQRRRARTAY